jgi:hypothetical protein
MTYGNHLKKLCLTKEMTIMYIFDDAKDELTESVMSWQSNYVNHHCAPLMCMTNTQIRK